MYVFVQSLVLNKYASLGRLSNTKYLPTSCALNTHLTDIAIILIKNNFTLIIFILLL